MAVDELTMVLCTTLLHNILFFSIKFASSYGFERLHQCTGSTRVHVNNVSTDAEFCNKRRFEFHRASTIDGDLELGYRSTMRHMHHRRGPPQQRPLSSTAHNPTISESLASIMALSQGFPHLCRSWLCTKRAREAHRSTVSSCLMLVLTWLIEDTITSILLFVRLSYVAVASLLGHCFFTANPAADWQLEQLWAAIP